MLIRNVGHLMMDEGVIGRDGQPAPEGSPSRLGGRLIA